MKLLSYTTQVATQLLRRITAAVGTLVLQLWLLRGWWDAESLWLLLALNMRWAFLCPHQCILDFEVDWPWDYQWKRRKLHGWGEEMGLEMPQWLCVCKKRRINKGYLLSWKGNTFPLSKFPAFLTNSPRSCPFSRLDFIQHQKNSFFLFFIFISCFLTSH